MSFECSIDAEYYVNLTEILVTSPGTEFCVECRRLIPQGEGHYIAYDWEWNEDGDETHLGQHTCCEQCGDLALSILEQGFCWYYGTIRDDIAEFNEEMGYKPISS